MNSLFYYFITYFTLYIFFTTVHSYSIHYPFNAKKDLAFITSASELYFDRLANFVGSVHYWEPTAPIDVYDLGLSELQLSKMANGVMSTFIQLDFNSYPNHLLALYNYAWKPIVMQHALKRHKAIV